MCIENKNKTKLLQNFKSANSWLTHKFNKHMKKTRKSMKEREIYLNVSSSHGIHCGSLCVNKARQVHSTWKPCVHSLKATYRSLTSAWEKGTALLKCSLWCQMMREEEEDQAKWWRVTKAWRGTTLCGGVMTLWGLACVTLWLLAV